MGNGARVPLLTYVKASGVIVLLDHGYLSLPVLFTNAIIQAYSWILIIVIWFPEPIPLPFIHVTGGFKTGAIMLLFLVPVLAFLNYFSAKLLLRLHSSLPTYSNTIESAQPKSVK